MQNQYLISSGLGILGDIVCTLNCAIGQLLSGRAGVARKPVRTLLDVL